jgi:ABC-type branched-subunit amino acid transport system substrate-binding protein
MIRSLFITSFVTVLAIVSRVSEAQTSETSTAPPTLKVGMIVPLAGNLSAYGVAARQGFQLAVKQAPNDFQGIEVLYDDSRYDGGTSISAFRSLTKLQHVDLVYVRGNLPSEGQPSE